jgi:hypothetical protein
MSDPTHVCLQANCCRENTSYVMDYEMSMYFPYGSEGTVPHIHNIGKGDLSVVIKRRKAHS